MKNLVKIQNMEIKFDLISFKLSNDLFKIKYIYQYNINLG